MSAAAGNGYCIHYVYSLWPRVTAAAGLVGGLARVGIEGSERQPVYRFQLISGVSGASLAEPAMAADGRVPSEDERAAAPTVARGRVTRGGGSKGWSD